jgi:methylmalonyl-CoA mutase
MENRETAPEESVAEKNVAGQGPLFEMFDPPSAEQWREETVASLKGIPFEKLHTRTYEGLTLQPIYRRSDAADIAHQHTLPGRPPYVRGANASGYLAASWLVAQAIGVGSPSAFNRALRHDLDRGQTAVHLAVDTATRAGLDPDQASVDHVGADGVSIATADDLVTALEGVDLAKMPVFIQPGTSALALGALLAAAIQSQGVAWAQLSGCLGSDPLGELARTGQLPCSLSQAYDEMAELTAWAQIRVPKLDTIVVDCSATHDGGGNAVQELGFALATGVDYLRAMLERGLDIDSAASRMRFVFALGGNFFMEVAKLRAARLLWSQIVAAFGGGDEAQKMTIHAQTARWNKTAIDPYVNMLRVTTEAFAGAVGGVGSMDVTPFDDVVRPADEFARRIARNTQLVLQSETNVARVIDPAGGSWYVEQLTDQLARGAWSLFQRIEGEGGKHAALEAGMPQALIAETAAKRIANLETRRDVLVGTNMYPNLNETPLSTANTDDAARDFAAQRMARIAEQRGHDPAISLATLAAAEPGARMAAAIAAAEAGATLGQLSQALRRGETASLPSITPIARARIAEPFEALRAAADSFAERTGAAPSVFLANMGPLVQHKARADFTAGFLAVGGFECDSPPGFDTPEDAADAALAAGAEAVVICSTDAAYPEIVPALVARIKASKPEAMVLLAGYPREQVEAFKEAGVDGFIHVRANCYEINRQLQERMGMV